jgi:hypothetical protein
VDDCAVAVNDYWLMTDDQPVLPTDRIMFYIDGDFVSELTMLMGTAGTFVRIFREFPDGQHTFEFVALASGQS